MVADEAGAINVYPHRDAERTKIAERTANVLWWPRRSRDRDRHAEAGRREASRYAVRFAGGRPVGYP